MTVIGPHEKMRPRGKVAKVRARAYKPTAKFRRKPR